MSDNPLEMQGGSTEPTLVNPKVKVIHTGESTIEKEDE